MARDGQSAFSYHLYHFHHKLDEASWLSGLDNSGSPRGLPRRSPQPQPQPQHQYQHQYQHQHQHRQPEHAGKFGPARQLVLPWITVCLTVISLILTALYASQTAAESRLRLLYSSSSTTIFVLSVLSGVTGVCLAATIGATYQRLQWVLIARSGGVRCSDFLSLHPGTGVSGLLALAFGRGQPLLNSTRLWSCVRLLSLVLVPIVGILIMSNVNTRVAFEIDDHDPLPLGWGMSPYNASLAKNVSIIADDVIQAQITAFLYDTSHAVDMTPAHLRAVPCAQGPGSNARESCERRYFISAGIEASTSAPQDGQQSFEDAILAKDQQGYILNFKEETDQSGFDDTVECETYGFAFAGFRLCLHNLEQNVLRARLVNCPSNVSALARCRSDTSWHGDPGWITTMTSNFKKAAVGYSRSNGTILSVEFSDAPETPAPVDAIEMLRGYRDAFGNFNSLQSLLTIFQSPEGTNLFALYVYPAYVWANLKGVILLGPRSPVIITRAAETLQSLLAITLYYCQPSAYARSLSKPAGNFSLAADGDAVERLKAETLAAAPADTEISLARLRYQIVVGRETYIAYVILCGSTLVLCIVLLLIGSYRPFAGHIPKTSSFPALDDMTHCRLESGSGQAFERLDGLRRLKGGDLIQAAAGLKIVLWDAKKRFDNASLGIKARDHYYGLRGSREAWQLSHTLLGNDGGQHWSNRTPNSPSTPPTSIPSGDSASSLNHAHSLKSYSRL